MVRGYDDGIALEFAVNLHDPSGQEDEPKARCFAQNSLQLKNHLR